MDSDTKCIVCDYEKVSNGVCTLTYKKVQALGLTGNVIIPAEFNVIGEGAFKGRTDILSVAIHSGVRKISKEAFSGCTGLVAVYCYGRLESIGKRAFADCTSLYESMRPAADYVAKDAYKLTAAEYVPPFTAAETEELTESVGRASGGSRLRKLGSLLLKLLIQLGILIALAMTLGRVIYLFASNYQGGFKAMHSSLVGTLAVFLLCSHIYYRFKDGSFRELSRETGIIPVSAALPLILAESVIFGDMLVWVNVYLLIALLIGELIFLGKYIYKRKWRFIFALLGIIYVTGAMLSGVLV